MNGDNLERRMDAIARERAARIVARRRYANRAVIKARPAVRAIVWTTLVLTFLVLTHSIAGLVFGTP